MGTDRDPGASSGGNSGATGIGDSLPPVDPNPNPIIPPPGGGSPPGGSPLGGGSPPGGAAPTVPPAGGTPNSANTQNQAATTLHNPNANTPEDKKRLAEQKQWEEKARLKEQWETEFLNNPWNFRLVDPSVPADQNNTYASGADLGTRPAGIWQLNYNPENPENDNPRIVKDFDKKTGNASYSLGVVPRTANEAYQAYGQLMDMALSDGNTDLNFTFGTIKGDPLQDNMYYLIGKQIRDLECILDLSETKPVTVSCDQLWDFDGKPPGPGPLYESYVQASKYDWSIRSVFTTEKGRIARAEKRLNALVVKLAEQRELQEINHLEAGADRVELNTAANELKEKNLPTQDANNPIDPAKLEQQQKETIFGKDELEKLNTKQKEAQDDYDPNAPPSEEKEDKKAALIAAESKRADALDKALEKTNELATKIDEKLEVLKENLGQYETALDKAKARDNPENVDAATIKNKGKIIKESKSQTIIDRFKKSSSDDPTASEVYRNRLTKQLDTSIADLRTRRALLQKELDTLKTSKLSDAERPKVKERIKEMETNLKALDKTIGKLEKKRDEVKEKVKEVDAKIDKRQTELNDAKKQASARGPGKNS